jgi:glycosyltransferase involved in cell wall biosynthesis
LKSTRILFITTQLPYPPKSGGTIKSWNYVQFLSQHYTLSIASLLKDDDEDHIESFQKAIHLENFESEKVQVERTPLNLLKSYFLSPCLNVLRNYSNKFKSKLIPLLEKADLVIVDHYEVFQYVPSDFTGKVIMHTHNAEFMLWQRMSELTNNPLKKLVLKVEAIRVKKYEKQLFSASDLVYSTPSDINLYRQHSFQVSKHETTYHLGNDTMLKLPNLEFQNTQKAITFIGTLSWEPNIDGICWFIENCWNSIQRKHPECTLYILGKNPDERILKSANNDSKIVFTGFVKNLDTYLQKTRVYIAPLRFGSGMKVKVLEGLYRGNPCVTTTVGAEGLELVNGENIVIADNPSTFAEGCLELLENEEKWEKFRNNIRKLAAEKYTWKALFAKMDEKLKELL